MGPGFMHTKLALSKNSGTGFPELTSIGEEVFPLKSSFLTVMVVAYVDTVAVTKGSV